MGWEEGNVNGGSLAALNNGPAFSGDTSGATDVVNLQNELNDLSIAAGNGGTAKLFLILPGVYYVDGPLYQPWNVRVYIDACVEIRAVGSWSATQDLWQDSLPTTVAAGSDGGQIENIASWASPSPGVLDVAATTGYPASGQIRVRAVYSTTVGADSNGGDITTIAAWATPAAGQLAVASTAEAGTSGTVTVATSAGTATVAYTGVGVDGGGNPVLTGCSLVDGSGTVSTGGAVTQNRTAIINYTGKTTTSFTGCTQSGSTIGIVSTGNAVSARTADGYLQGKGTLNANGRSRHALWLHFFAGFTIGVRCTNSVQDDVVLGDSAALSSSFGPTLTLEFCTDRTTGSTPSGGYRSLWVTSSCSDGVFYGSQDAQLIGQQIGIQCDGADWKFNNAHPWSHDNGMTIAFYDNAWNNRWLGCTADSPTSIGLQLGTNQNHGEYDGLVVQIPATAAYPDNTVIAVKNLGSGQSNNFSKWCLRGADATHRLKQDYNGDKSNTNFFGCADQVFVAAQVISTSFVVPSASSGAGSALSALALRAAASDVVDIFNFWTTNFGAKLGGARHDGLLYATTSAVATKEKAGAPVDGDWTTAPPDGTIVVDSTNNKLWARVGGAWKGVTIA